MKSRKPRLYHPGALYHVMLRGNAKQTIFGDERAYHQFEKILAEGLDEHKHRLHAYCWMGNHIHMLLQSADQPISGMMKVLSQRYTQWFNKRHDRSGHLFQGRYKALMVDADSYLLELVRYIHLNPVRAELVEQVDDYPWSSHHAYLGRQTTPWLTTDWVLRQFDEERGAARARYLRFLGEPVDRDREAELSRGTIHGRVIGSDDFLRRMEERAESSTQINVTLDQITDTVCGQENLNRQELLSASRRRATTQARALITLLAVEYSGKTLTETAHYFDRNLTVLSQQMKKLRERAEKFPEQQKIVDDYLITLKTQT